MLSTQEKNLVSEVLREKKPEKNWNELIEALDTVNPSDRELIVQILLDKFYENLDSNDEPNQLGREIDTIIGKISFEGDSRNSK